MKRLLFATNNRHKLSEIRDILEGLYEVVGLDEIPFTGEIPETQPTLEGNALQKARFIYDRFHINCFADDTGLEVEALDGAPGVISARYAGLNVTYADNVEKLLKEMRGKENRKACFRTLIALILEGKEHLFEGRVDGIIIDHPRGVGGFGYDPVFVPDDFKQTFSEMDPKEKNAISHRGDAVRKLHHYLRENHQ